MKKDDVQLERIYEKPLTIFGKPMRVKKLMLIALVMIFLGVFGYSEVNLIGWIVAAVLGVALLIFSAFLYQKSILYFGKYSLEASPSGDMFITILHGHCSKCDGHLKVVKKGKVSYIQCDKDPKHVWNLYANFDESKKS